MQHIIIRTNFDITNTGVTRNFKRESLPLKTKNGYINTEEEWILARRQQSNWETLIQVISLRAQPMHIQTRVNNGQWILEFDIEQMNVYKKEDVGELAILIEDCENVPMLINLTEKRDPGSVIQDRKNIWFEYYEI